MRRLALAYAAIFATATCFAQEQDPKIAAVIQQMEKRSEELTELAREALENMNPLDRPDDIEGLLKKCQDPFSMNRDELDLATSKPGAAKLVYFRVTYLTLRGDTDPENLEEPWGDIIRIARALGLEDESFAMVNLRLRRPEEYESCIKTMNKLLESTPSAESVLNDFECRRAADRNMFTKTAIGKYVQIAETPAFREKLAKKKQQEEEKEEADRMEANAARFASESRTWTDKSGKFTTVAVFAFYLDGTVTLEKKDGSTVDLKIADLSIPDQQFIRKKLREQKK